MAQDTNGWEAIIIGDKCPHFQKLIDSGWIYDKQVESLSKGNKLIAFNADKHTGGCGYKMTNFAIQNARGKYLVFFANDDLIQPNHFSHYLEIEGTDYDYMYFNSYISPLSAPRIPRLAPSEIGHSEIIVKTELARRAPAHENKYGHDWDFIRFISEHGKGAKSESELTTYHVRSVPNYGTVDTID